MTVFRQCSFHNRVDPGTQFFDTGFRWLVAVSRINWIKNYKLDPAGRKKYFTGRKNRTRAQNADRYYGISGFNCQGECTILKTSQTAISGSMPFRPDGNRTLCFEQIFAFSAYFIPARLDIDISS